MQENSGKSLSQCPKAQGDGVKRKVANPYNLKAGTRRCSAFYARKRTINRSLK